MSKYDPKKYKNDLNYRLSLKKASQKWYKQNAAKRIAKQKELNKQMDKIARNEYMREYLSLIHI